MAVCGGVLSEKVSGGESVCQTDARRILEPLLGLWREEHGAKLAKHPLHQCGNKSTVFAVWEELQLFNCSLAGKAATRVHRVAVVCHFPIAYIMIQLLPC